MASTLTLTLPGGGTRPCPRHMAQTLLPSLRPEMASSNLAWRRGPALNQQVSVKLGLSTEG